MRSKVDGPKGQGHVISGRPYGKVDGLGSKVDGYKGSKWTTILTTSTLTPLMRQSILYQDRPLWAGPHWA